MKYFDQHVHTRFSVDSKEEPENYLKIASSKGVPVFVSTEHLEFDWNNEGLGWTPDFAAQIDLYRDLSEKYPTVSVRHGIEIGYKKDHVDEINELIEKFKFSHINLSVHDYKGFDIYHPEICEKFPPDELLKGNFENILTAINDKIDYDVLCHVDYAFKTAYLADGSVEMSSYRSFLEEIFKTVIRLNKAVEVNAKVQKRIGSLDPLEYWLGLYKKLGGTLLTLSSDAHKTADYMQDMTDVVNVIKKCGFDSLCLYNEHVPTLVKIDELF